MAHCAATAFFLFLALSANPVQAFRAQQLESSLSSLERLEAEQLRDVLRQWSAEGSADLADEPGWADPAGCGRFSLDFEREAHGLGDLYRQSLQDGQVNAIEAAKVILEARKLVKTATAAQAHGCEGADAAGFNGSAARGFLADLAQHQPCLEQARKGLLAAADLDVERQQDAVVRGLGMLLSEDCEVPRLEKPSQASVDDALGHLTASAGEERRAAADLSRMLAEPTTTTTWDAVESTPLSGRYEYKWDYDWMMDEEGMREMGFFYSLVEKQASTGGLAALMGILLGFLLAAVLWLLICWAVAAAFLFLLGLVLCVLKVVIVALLRHMGDESRRYDFKGCAAFWLGAMKNLVTNRHTVGNLAFCAAGMISPRGNDGHGINAVLGLR